MKISKRQHNALFYLWLILCLGLLLLLGKGWLGGFDINTNLLSLLPKNQYPANTQTAIDRFSSRMSRQVVVLIGQASEQKAIASASLFSNALSQSGLFVSIQDKVETSEQAAWAALYFPYRYALLSPSDRALMQANNTAAIYVQALQSFYNPMGANSDGVLKTDPLFLFQHYLFSLPKPATHLNLSNGYLVAQSRAIHYVMINAELRNGSFNLGNQQAVVNEIARVKHAVEKAYPGSTILTTGMVFFAQAGAQSAQHDIRLIGIGSIIGIILLMLWVFRGLSPLFFTLFSAIVGIVAGFLVCEWVFGSINLLALVFGASLIGICVDYAFFFLSDRMLGGASWNVLACLQRILPGTSLGLLNIIVAFAVMACLPFPGLKQLAVFGAVGLFFAFLTVIAFLPRALKKPVKPVSSRLLTCVSRYLSLWKKATAGSLILSIILLLVFIFLGVLKLHADDKIQRLQALPAALVKESSRLQAIIGNHFSQNMILVSGKTPEETLTHASHCLKKIQQHYASVASSALSVAQYLPTQTQQHHDHELIVKTYQQGLKTYFQKIHLKPELIEPLYHQAINAPARSMTVKDWLSSPASQRLRYLWLGRIGDHYFTAILVSNQIPSTSLSVLLKHQPGVTWIDRADSLSQVFKVYRQRLSYLLVLIYALVFLGFLYRYRQKAFVYILPPLLASLTSLACLGYLGWPVTLFSVLALMLVLGISVDYVVFFAETRGRLESTMLAITLSALVTILSFGLLAFSATPAVGFFGLTVGVGILVAWLLSPWVSRFKGNEHHV